MAGEEPIERFWYFGKGAANSNGSSSSGGGGE